MYPLLQSLKRHNFVLGNGGLTQKSITTLLRTGSLVFMNLKTQFFLGDTPLDLLLDS
jgi:hypothetical protein